MLLLSFTVRNHKSIRDEVTLDLTKSDLRTLQPGDGDWAAVTYPLAALYGGNATGKSAVLDAMRYAFAAVVESATTWQARKTMFRAPFRLDSTSEEASSTYELDFVHDGRRHLYWFEVDREGIRREQLRDLPASRWRTLLDRDRDGGVLKFHPALRGRIDVTPRELVLSRALLIPGSVLHDIAVGLVSSYDFVSVKDSHREARLADIADSLLEKTIDANDMVALLMAADIGIQQISADEEDLPESFQRLVRALMKEPKQGTAAESSEAEEPPVEVDPGTDLRGAVVRSLLFTHRGVENEQVPFRIQDESDGTIAWLAVAVPALETLRRGGLLLVDEIDASLHPHLVEILLAAFEDPEINRKHAQLIFTTHDTHLLSPQSDVKLEPEQVWITDKTYDGVTELACLAEFPKHPDANVAKRYLAGRYGGVPRLAPSILADLVDVETSRR